MGGVLLAYGKLRFADSVDTVEAPSGGGQYLHAHTAAPLARMFDELPYMHVRVSFDALLFKPKLGDTVKGKVHSLAGGHIGLLVGGLFNASIPLADMAGGYTWNELDNCWDATELHSKAVSSLSSSSALSGHKRRREEEASGADSSNSLLAANPSRISHDSSVVFLVKSISHSMGVMLLYGSLESSALQPALQSSVPKSGAGAAAAAGGAGARKSAAAAAKDVSVAEGEEEEKVATEEEEERTKKPVKKERKDSAAISAKKDAAPVAAAPQKEEGKKKKKEKKEKA